MSTITTNSYEPAPEYPHEVMWAVRGWTGVAFSVLGWETEPDQDTEWSGCENRTGNLIAVMVGDDRHFSVDPDDLSELDEKSYCHECGQIGCHCA